MHLTVWWIVLQRADSYITRLHTIYSTLLQPKFHLRYQRTPRMKAAAILVALLFTTCFLSSVDSWRRRRRRRCKRDCTPGSWSSWSTCTKPCGRGTQYRTRGISVPAICGGSCSHALRATQSCNTQCCPVNCAWSWNQWGPCSGCGISHKTRTIKITRNPSCGGAACPSQTRVETISCDTGV